MNTEDEILGMIATEAAASGSVERFVRRMSDDTLHALERAMRLEFEDRREAACEAEDRCPDCVCGYAGSETDHEPCERCGTTGKYFPPNKEL